MSINFEGSYATLSVVEQYDLNEGIKLMLQGDKLFESLPKAQRLTQGKPYIDAISKLKPLRYRLAENFSFNRHLGHCYYQLERYAKAHESLALALSLEPGRDDAILFAKAEQEFNQCNAIIKKAKFKDNFKAKTQRFWELFTKRESLIRELLVNQTPSSTEAAQALVKDIAISTLRFANFKLYYHQRDLHPHHGSHKDHSTLEGQNVSDQSAALGREFELILQPFGNSALYYPFEFVIKCAPQELLEHWRFSLGAEPDRGYTLDIDGVKISAADISVVVTKVAPTPIKETDDKIDFTGYQAIDDMGEVGQKYHVSSDSSNMIPVTNKDGEPPKKASKGKKGASSKNQVSGVVTLKSNVHGYENIKTIDLYCEKLTQISHGNLKLLHSRLFKVFFNYIGDYLGLQVCRKLGISVQNPQERIAEFQSNADVTSGVIPLSNLTTTLKTMGVDVQDDEKGFTSVLDFPYQRPLASINNDKLSVADLFSADGIISTRSDLFMGLTKLRSLLRDYVDNNNTFYGRFYELGVAPGYFVLPVPETDTRDLKEHLREMEQRGVDFAHPLEKLHENDFKIIGYGLGVRCIYIDVLIWDSSELLVTAKKIGKKMGLPWLSFKSFCTGVPPHFIISPSSEALNEAAENQ